MELACRRGRLNFKPAPRLKFDGTHEGMMELTRVYRRANEDRMARQRLASTGGEFTATLKVPDTVEGPCAIRVFVRGTTDCAVGAATLYIARHESSRNESSSAAGGDGTSQETISP